MWVLQRTVKNQKAAAAGIGKDEEWPPGLGQNTSDEQELKEHLASFEGWLEKWAPKSRSKGKSRSKAAKSAASGDPTAEAMRNEIVASLVELNRTAELPI